MEKRIALLTAHVRVGISKDKPNRSKEITFSGAIAANDHIMLRRKGLDYCLLLVALVSSAIAECDGISRSKPFEALNDDLFDIHRGETLKIVEASHPGDHNAAFKLSSELCHRTSLLVEADVADRFNASGRVIFISRLKLGDSSHVLAPSHRSARPYFLNRHESYA